MAASRKGRGKLVTRETIAVVENAPPAGSGPTHTPRRSVIVEKKRMTQHTYAYIPRAADNVYEDMGVAVVVMQGPAETTARLHAVILAAVSPTDLEANERVLRNMVVAAGEARFGDLDSPEMEAPYSHALHDTLVAASAEITWTALESKKDLDKAQMVAITKIPFIYYHYGGMGYS